MLAVELVHQQRVDNQDEDKADDGPLLGHPEAEGSVADLGKSGIQPVTQKDSGTKTDGKPDDEEAESEFQTGAPMGVGFFVFHDDGLSV